MPGRPVERGWLGIGGAWRGVPEEVPLGRGCRTFRGSDSGTVLSLGSVSKARSELAARVGEGVLSRKAQKKGTRA